MLKERFNCSENKAIDKAVLTTIAQAMISNRMRLLECFITADKISPFIACN